MKQDRFFSPYKKENKFESSLLIILRLKQKKIGRKVIALDIFLWAGYFGRDRGLWYAGAMKWSGGYSPLGTVQFG